MNGHLQKNVMNGTSFTKNKMNDHLQKNKMNDHLQKNKMNGHLQKIR